MQFISAAKEHQGDGEMQIHKEFIWKIFSVVV
jgi:hypothetical protein